MQLAALHQVAQLEHRGTHLNPQRLGQIVPAHHASVVVAGHHNWRRAQPGPEQHLNRAVEPVVPGLAKG